MSTIVQEPVRATPRTGIPPLLAGDRLSCDEFERRYEQMPLVREAAMNHEQERSNHATRPTVPETR